MGLLTRERGRLKLFTTGDKVPVVARRRWSAFKEYFMFHVIH